MGVEPHETKLSPSYKLGLQHLLSALYQENGEKKRIMMIEQDGITEEVVREWLTLQGKDPKETIEAAHGDCAPLKAKDLVEIIHMNKDTVCMVIGS